MLYILDRSIDTVGGHQQLQIAGLESLAGDLTFKVIACAKADSELQFDDRRLVRALAPQKPTDHPHGDLIDGDEARLKAVLDLDSGSVCRNVVLTTARAYDIRLCLAFLESYEGGARFFLRFLSDVAFRHISKDEHARLQGQIANGNIRIVTETFGMVDILADRHGIPASADLLLPCSISVKSLIQAPNKEPSVFKIGYLGGQRLEKGYARIPEIIRSIREEMGRAGITNQVEFVTQKTKNRRLKLKQLKYNWNLRRAAGSSIRIVRLDGYLTDNAFIDAVQSVDVLLVPYDVDEYAGRGSGIVLDGVMLCKPIVYSKGIGMTEFLTHGNAEAATTADEFGTMICRVLGNLPNYIANAGKARLAAIAQLDRAAAFLKTLEISDAKPC